MSTATLTAMSSTTTMARLKLLSDSTTTPFRFLQLSQHLCLVPLVQSVVVGLVVVVKSSSTSGVSWGSYVSRVEWRLSPVLDIIVCGVYFASAWRPPTKVYACSI